MKLALESKQFKQQLLSFLIKEWAKNEYKGLLKECTLFFNFDKVCTKLTATDDGVQSEVIPALRNTHEEADTMIELHAKHTNMENTNAKIVICANDNLSICINDTDILVIMIYHANHLMIKIWMDVGFKKDNTRRYLCVKIVRRAWRHVTCITSTTCFFWQ